MVWRFLCVCVDRVGKFVTFSPATDVSRVINVANQCPREEEFVS